MGPLGNGLSISVTAAANVKFVAVTGADGFIGSHIVNILLRKGYMVRGTVLDIDLANHLTELPKADENLSLFKADLRVDGVFDNVFEGCDCVFHVASPTLKNQREMKMPEKEMIKDAVFGTNNVLKSCKKAGVKAVILTSSQSAASPGPKRPKMINESHWSDPEVLMKKGHYYNASKTMAERAAVDFVANMSTESAFRLVRICPTFTVGPMLQPTVNSSMYRFAAICDGSHHKQIPNDSRSLIDVRDTAAHHVAAYEKGLEGRFFSTTEAWPWTLIYQALKFYRPLMNCPVSLPLGINHRPVREYSKTRMNVLGVKERSMMQILGDAVKECEQKNLISESPSILDVAGYYDLDSGSGLFLMVDVQIMIEPNVKPYNQARISYVIDDTQDTPFVTNYLPTGLLQVGQNPGDFILTLDNYPGTPDMNLSFHRLSGEKGMLLKGSIKSTPITGRSYITYIPLSVFTGTYTTKDGSGTVALALDGVGSYLISFSDNLPIDTFSYDPIKRKFEFDDSGYTRRMYMNVATDVATNVGAGSGIIIRYVQFLTAQPKGTGSTRVYLLNTKPVIGPNGPTVGAENLGAFAGYYSLNNSPQANEGTFVSITKLIGPTNVVNVGVGVCTDGQNSTQYYSYTFQNNMLTFPLSSGAPTIKFKTIPYGGAFVNVGQNAAGDNYFSLALLEAFGYRTLTGKYSKSTTLRIIPTDGPARIVFTIDGGLQFDTTEYVYNPVEQSVVYNGYRLNFCYNLKYGATCGVTRTNVAKFNTVLFAYP